MKRLILICAIFLVTGMTLNVYGQISTLWERNSRTGAADVKPTWFGTSTERGIAYGLVGGNHRLYVPSRNGGTFVYVLNAETGANIQVGDPLQNKVLNVTGISDGLYTINDAEVSDDGIIFVCNMTTSASTTAFKVYMWSGEDAIPTLAFSYTGAAVRLGDKFTVTGSFSDNTAIIWAASATIVAGTANIYKFTMSSGTFSSVPTIIPLSDNVTGGNPTVGPLPDGSFYFNYAGINPKKYSSSGTLLGTVSGSTIATGSTSTKFLKTVGNDDYFITYSYGTGTNDERGNLVKVIGKTPLNNATNEVIYGRTQQQGAVSSAGNSDLDIRDNGDGTYTVYVLGTNLGLGAYSTTTGSIGWANLQSPASANISTSGSADIYAQVWVDGVTNSSGQGAGISAWVGYSTSNTNPNTWTNWVPATYYGDAGNNDEYKATLTGLPAGLYYYASRFQNQLGQYYYGGYNGGAWDGTTNVSGVLWITGNTIDGNLNESNYTQLATKQNSNSGFGGDIDISKIVYSIDQTNNLLYLGFYGKIPTGNANGIGLWLDFSQLTGVSSGVALGNNPGVTHYLGNTGNNNFKADFQVDYMFGLNSGSSSNCYVDLVKLVGGSTGSYLGNASINGTAVMGPSTSGVLSKYGSLFSFNNSAGEKTGFEIVIPFSELGVTSVGTISAFGVVVSSTGFFSDVTVPGNIVTEANPGFNADFSTLAGSPFHSAPSLLPVELSSFIHYLKGNAVDLKWSTKTEVNSYKFEIERSLSGQSSSLSSHLLWEAVGEVNASGNSNSPKEYSFSDKNLAEGKYSYRLKMIDNDGTFEYSPVVEVEVEVPNTFALSQNYPNPFNPVTQIQYQLPVNSQVKLMIYSITGELVTTLVDENQVAGNYTVPFNASALASGTYIYRLIAGDFVATKKMVVLK